MTSAITTTTEFVSESVRGRLALVASASDDVAFALALSSNRVAHTTARPLPLAITLWEQTTHSKTRHKSTTAQYVKAGFEFMTYQGLVYPWKHQWKRCVCCRFRQGRVDRPSIAPHDTGSSRTRGTSCNRRHCRWPSSTRSAWERSTTKLDGLHTRAAGGGKEGYCEWGEKPSSGNTSKP